ncbi:MAG TPA: glycosyltransferase family 2 protein [Thermodesulfovibrionales bacterium]|nr:glycosyltransferase family 2 protein [Thermodesulfovibrionales bacterium]
MTRKVCCIIPAFNEEKRIVQVISGVRRHIPDVIVVDDGSHDGTAARAERAGAVVIRHASNRGKGMALRTGFGHALRRDYAAVLTLDGDGQHAPEEIAKFLSAFRAGSGDIIIGSRLWDKAAIPRYRYIPNRIGIFCISKAAGCRIDDTQSGFRLYRREVLETIPLTTTGFETETEALIRAGRAGFRIHSFPVPAIYHRDYRTNFRPVRDFYRISILFLKLTVLGGRK